MYYTYLIQYRQARRNTGAARSRPQEGAEHVGSISSTAQGAYAGADAMLNALAAAIAPGALARHCH